MKISKNKRSLSTNQKKETPEKIAINKNLLYWSIGMSALNFVLSYQFYPGLNVAAKANFNPANLISLNFIYSAIIFAVIYFSSNQKVKSIANYLFLFAFSIVTFSYLSVFNEIETGIIYILRLYLRFAVVPIAILGIIAIWQNKSLLNGKEHSADKPDVDTKKGFIKKIFFSIKNLGTPTLLSFFTIIILVSVLLFYELDTFDFWSDEKQTTQAAVGYYYTGEYYQWDFIKDEANTGQKYNRALPHVWLVAQSYNLFGISEWSSRFVSAISGVLFAIFGFFVALFFSKSKLAALLFIFAVALNYQFLHLFRWTRMYAILIPYTFIVFYIIYKTITGTNKYIIVTNSITSYVNKYLNFNFLFLIILLPLIYLGFKIHPNFLAILPPVLLFLLFLAFTEKEVKYYLAIVVVILSFFIIYLFLPEYIPSARMSFFDVYNSYYLNGFFDKPFNLFTGLVLLALGIGVLIFSGDKKKKLRLAYLYTFTFSFYILFTYMADYPQSFRYISHLAPISILLIVTIYSSLFLIYSKPWQVALLLALIIGSLLSHFYRRYPDLYIDNPVYNAHPSVAFETIEKNHKKGEAVFLQYSTPYYLRDLDQSTPVINMSRDKRYSFQTFLKDINNYDAGWISWSSFNQYHIDDDIVQYCNFYFTKYHGYGIDDTNKEVFYFQKHNIVPDSIFRFDSNFPLANLKLNGSYSITFWISLDEGTRGFPIKVTNKNRDLIRFTQFDGGKFYVKYNENDSAQFIVPPDNRLHFFALEQTGNQENDTVKITIDQQLMAKIVLTNSEDTIAKLNVNRRFNSQVDDMRVYAHLLNDKQKQVLSNRGLSLKKRELKVIDKSFTPLFYWTKN